MKAIKEVMATPGITLPKYPVVYKENNNFIMVSSVIAKATIKLARIKRVNNIVIPEYNKNTINLSSNFTKFEKLIIGTFKNFIYQLF